jgi:hypothetical protein
MVNEQNSCCCCGEFLLFPVPSPHPLDQKRRAWKALKGNQDVARLNRLNQSLFLEKKKEKRRPRYVPQGAMKGIYTTVMERICHDSSFPSNSPAKKKAPTVQRSQVPPLRHGRRCRRYTSQKCYDVVAAAIA